LRCGFGFAVIHHGQLVSGASSMTVYNGGIEIKVATDENYRRKGLALPCAAALVLECLNRKRRPHWDAANEISKKMAIKLGFEYTGEYTSIHLRRKV
jgi:predicted GNAT family acetyltransferase